MEKQVLTLDDEELQLILKHRAEKARLHAQEISDKNAGFLKNEYGMYYRLDKPGNYYIRNCDGTFKSWGPAPDGKNEFFD